MREFIGKFMEITKLTPFATDSNNWAVCLNEEQTDFCFIEHDLIIALMEEKGLTNFHDTFVAMGTKMFKWCKENGEHLKRMKEDKDVRCFRFGGSITDGRLAMWDDVLFIFAPKAEFEKTKTPIALN